MTKDAKQPRRTHAERSAETKVKIIQAVVDCIAELGIQKTTANAIAKKAGVTWGALQHHFGGKNGCLAATLEDSFTRFSVTLGDPPSPLPSLPDRIDLFIDRAWIHYCSPHYHSMLALLNNDLSEIYQEEEWQKHQNQLFQSLDSVWENFFPTELSDMELRLTIAHYTHSVLTGLAITHRLWNARDLIQVTELNMLKQSIQLRLSNG